MICRSVSFGCCFFWFLFLGMFMNSFSLEVVFFFFGRNSLKPVFKVFFFKKGFAFALVWCSDVQLAKDHNRYCEFGCRPTEQLASVYEFSVNTGNFEVLAPYGRPLLDWSFWAGPGLFLSLCVPDVQKNGNSGSPGLSVCPYGEGWLYACLNSLGFCFH